MELTNSSNAAAAPHKWRASFQTYQSLQALHIMGPHPPGAGGLGASMDWGVSGSRDTDQSLGSATGVGIRASPGF